MMQSDKPDGYDFLASVVVQARTNVVELTAYVADEPPGPLRDVLLALGNSELQLVSMSGSTITEGLTMHDLEKYSLPAFQAEVRKNHSCQSTKLDGQSSRPYLLLITALADQIKKKPASFLSEQYTASSAATELRNMALAYQWRSERPFVSPNPEQPKTLLEALLTDALALVQTPYELALKTTVSSDAQEMLNLVFLRATQELEYKSQLFVALSKANIGDKQRHISSVFSRNHSFGGRQGFTQLYDQYFGSLKMSPAPAQLPVVIKVQALPQCSPSVTERLASTTPGVQYAHASARGHGRRLEPRSLFTPPAPSKKCDQPLVLPPQRDEDSATWGIALSAGIWLAGAMFAIWQLAGMQIMPVFYGVEALAALVIVLAAVMLWREASSSLPEPGVAPLRQGFRREPGEAQPSGNIKGAVVPVGDGSLGKGDAPVAQAGNALRSS